VETTRKRTSTQQHVKASKMTRLAQFLKRTNAAATVLLSCRLRPVIAAIVAFVCYGRALPGALYVYWTMFLIAAAGAFTMFRCAEIIERSVEPED
jgi:hypothetical protein